ncbi:hypothetical protein DFH09DRAFT_1091647 [Mycena vulgaris]|nr:hypothetical protein DFH09DRAFT_1091647 [Mycena vulgaris]
MLGFIGVALIVPVVEMAVDDMTIFGHILPQRIYHTHGNGGPKFSPEAYTRHFETQARIARWTESTHRVPQADAFAPPTPPPARPRSRVGAARARRAATANASAPRRPRCYCNNPARPPRARRLRRQRGTSTASSNLFPPRSCSRTSNPSHRHRRRRRTAARVRARRPRPPPHTRSYSYQQSPVAQRQGSYPPWPGFVYAQPGPCPQSVCSPFGAQRTRCRCSGGCWLWRQRERREAESGEKPESRFWAGEGKGEGGAEEERYVLSKPCAALAPHHIHDPPSDERAQGTLLSPPLLLPPYIPVPAPHIHISPFAVPSDYRCRSTVLLRNAPLRDYRRRGHPPTTAPPSHIPPCPLHPVPRRCGTSVLALPRCGDYPSHPHLFPRFTTHL